MKQKVNNEFSIKADHSLVEIGRKDGAYLWLKNNSKVMELVFVEDGILYEQPYYGDELVPIDRPLNFSPNAKRFVSADSLQDYILQLKNTIKLLERTKVRK